MEYTYFVPGYKCRLLSHKQVSHGFEATDEENVLNALFVHSTYVERTELLGI